MFTRPRESGLRNCVKVEVAVLGSRPLWAYGFCGRKATLIQPDRAKAGSRIHGIGSGCVGPGWICAARMRLSHVAGPWPAWSLHTSPQSGISTKATLLPPHSRHRSSLIRAMSRRLTRSSHSHRLEDKVDATVRYFVPVACDDARALSCLALIYCLFVLIYMFVV